MTDDGLFEALYQAHYDDLLRYALRRVEEPADAADVVAETWAVAWRRRADLPAAAEQRLWLFGVARRALANQRRGRLRQQRLADRLREELTTTWQPATAPADSLARALATLRPTDRDLLGMQAWEQLTTAEIGAVLGCSEAAVRVRLHRARRRLRTALDGLQEHEPDRERSREPSHEAGRSTRPMPALHRPALTKETS